MAGEVFAWKRRQRLDETMKKLFDAQVAHIPMPTFNGDHVINHLIKPEHRQVLETAELAVGPIQSHDYIEAHIGSAKLIVRFQSNVKRLLPIYAKQTEINPTDPLWADLLSWYRARRALAEQFAEAGWAFARLNNDCGSLANLKLHMHAITLLMAKTEGFEKLADKTRQIKAPANMPSVHPELRAAGRRASTTLVSASMCEAKAIGTSCQVQWHEPYTTPLGTSYNCW